MKAKIIGRYIVADPDVCHGKPIFKGTRILVSDVLQQVSSGMDWETIVDEWNNNIDIEAINEAVTLASKAFVDHADEFIVEPSAV